MSSNGDCECEERRERRYTRECFERPRDVPLRQWVLTLPFELRARLAYDRELLGVVGRLFVDTVLRW